MIINHFFEVADLDAYKNLYIGNAYCLHATDLEKSVDYFLFSGLDNVEYTFVICRFVNLLFHLEDDGEEVSKLF